MVSIRDEVGEGMLTSNRQALKEWAVVCHALASGRQAILLRAGGLAEAGEQFPVHHSEFWLFATRFHQAADELADDAVAHLDSLADLHPPEGKVRLPVYATVERTFRLEAEPQVAALAAYHILAPQTALNRFHYRRPGLTVLLVRAFVPPEPFDVPDSPHFAGCHSWVELPTALETKNLKPALNDDDFRQVSEEVTDVLHSPGS